MVKDFTLPSWAGIRATQKPNWRFLDKLYRATTSTKATVEN